VFYQGKQAEINLTFSGSSTGTMTGGLCCGETFTAGTKVIGFTIPTSLPAKTQPVGPEAVFLLECAGTQGNRIKLNIRAEVRPDI
jgi:hypothetical protein